MQLDIFADTPDLPAATVAPCAAPAPAQALPVAGPESVGQQSVGHDADWCMKVLEQGLASSKRQLTALCASPGRLSVVLDAVWTIAQAKRSAYERASRGERLSAMGCANGPLGEAGAVLSAVFLPNDAIPMTDEGSHWPHDAASERQH